MEFAVQPFDLPRRDVIQANSMFDTPTYRWLPANSKIASSFVMFYTSTPEGFVQVDDVVLANGFLTIQDRAHGKSIVLKASRGLSSPQKNGELQKTQKNTGQKGHRKHRRTQQKTAMF